MFYFNYLHGVAASLQMAIFQDHSDGWELQGRAYAAKEF